VNYLLDTHVMLWWFRDMPLSSAATAVLSELENQIYVSPVTAWELSIKAAKGHVDLSGSYLDAVSESGFQILNITWSHAVAAAELPAHHKDPFDRLLLGQASVEGMTVVSRDAHFVHYDIPLIEA